jgi:glutamate carboxypeptidase
MTGANMKADGLPSYFHARQTDILDFMRWLVEQESMTRNAEATARIAENLGERLAADGASVDLLRDSKWGATLRARFGAEGDRDAPEKQLLVIGHLDTVWPIGTLSERPFRIEDDRAYGPGIFDMKAGVTPQSSRCARSGIWPGLLSAA